MKNFTFATSVVFWVFAVYLMLLKPVLAPEKTVTKTETVYDTVLIDSFVIDTVFVDLTYDPPRRYSGWTQQEKIEFVKYVNTQQRVCNLDQWAVIQVMLNICKAGGWTWTEYSTKYHHEGNFFDNCRAGLIWSYTYDPDNKRDSTIMARIEMALAGKVPQAFQIPETIIAFESHPSGWNKNVKKGLWRRDMIGLTLVHEFYYDWSKVTDEERAAWERRLKDMETLHKLNVNG